MPSQYRPLKENLYKVQESLARLARVDSRLREGQVDAATGNKRNLLRLKSRTGFHLKPLHWTIEKENYFRASRRGLEARYIADEQGHSYPIRVIVPQIVEALMPTAAQLGTTDYLQALNNAALHARPNYMRQRLVFQKTGSLQAIVAELARQLDAAFEQPHCRLPATSL